MRIIQQKKLENYIKQYERLIFTICFSFTKNYFDAEDLTQEAFLSASKSIDKFDGGNVKAWLTTIAANKCKDYLKSRTVYTQSLSDEDYKCLRDNRGSPEEQTIEADTNQRIYGLCQKLKEPYKTIAINYFCDNVKLSEVARDTGQNLKTLQTQLYRAKKLLKDLWKEESYEKSI